MKNLFKNALCGFLVCCLSLIVLTTKAYSPAWHYKTEKTGKVFKAEKNQHFVVAGYAVNMQADLNCASPEMLIEARVIYIQPGNDPKPDNTHYQLVRKETLKLHKAIRDC